MKSSIKEMSNKAIRKKRIQNNLLNYIDKDEIQELRVLFIRLKVDKKKNMNASL